MYADKLGSPATVMAARPVSTMEDAISSVHARISELEGCFNAMVSRLSGVLQPVPPKADQAGGNLAPVPTHSEAVNEIHLMKARLEELVIRVNDTTSRLET
jgi:hypothetical protein